MLARLLFRNTIHDSSVSVGFLLLRLVAGLAMFQHGWMKMGTPSSWMGPSAPFPELLQFAAALSQTVGGLAWVLGLLTLPFSVFVGITMFVATWMHVLIWSDPFVAQGQSYELAALYLAVSMLLGLAGPGRYSLDALIRRNRS